MFVLDGVLNESTDEKRCSHPIWQTKHYSRQSTIRSNNIFFFDAILHQPNPPVRNQPKQDHINPWWLQGTRPSLCSIVIKANDSCRCAGEQTIDNWGIISSALSWSIFNQSSWGVEMLPFILFSNIVLYTQCTLKIHLPKYKFGWVD